MRFELEGTGLQSILRPTDEVALDNGAVSILMKGRDEFEAFAAVKKIGVVSAEFRPAGRITLLAGPGSTFAPADAIEAL